MQVVRFVLPHCSSGELLLSLPVKGYSTSLVCTCTCTVKFSIYDEESVTCTLNLPLWQTIVRGKGRRPRTADRGTRQTYTP